MINYLPLEHKTEKPMKTLIGDIRNQRIVLNALEDVDCVIHCAAIMNNSGLFQDEKMMKSVNVDGKSFSSKSIQNTGNNWF